MDCMDKDIVLLLQWYGGVGLGWVGMDRSVGTINYYRYSPSFILPPFHHFTPSLTSLPPSISPHLSGASAVSCDPSRTTGNVYFSQPPPLPPLHPHPALHALLSVSDDFVDVRTIARYVKRGCQGCKGCERYVKRVCEWRRGCVRRERVYGWWWCIIRVIVI